MISSPQARSELVCFLPTQIPHVWETVKPHIERALNRGSRYTIADIVSGLLDGTMQLWTSFNQGCEAALVTSIQDGYCLLLAASGENMDEWVQWLPIVEAWAKEHDCESMRLYGRRGWSKVLGYEIDYTAMSKTL